MGRSPSAWSPREPPGGCPIGQGRRNGWGRGPREKPGMADAVERVSRPVTAPHEVRAVHRTAVRVSMIAQGVSSVAFKASRSRGIIGNLGKIPDAVGSSLDADAKDLGDDLCPAMDEVGPPVLNL